MTMKTTKVNPKTPLGQVILEKREIRRLCQETEEKISADWQYIRSHAGRLMWSEISAVLMPHRRNNGEKQARALRVIHGSIWPGNWENRFFTVGWEKWDGKSLKVCSVVAAQSENTKNG